MQNSAMPLPFDEETIAALLDWYERMQAYETDFEEGAELAGMDPHEFRLHWLKFHFVLADIARRKEMH